MDKNKTLKNKIMAEQTIKALKANNMNAMYVDSKEDVVPLIKTMLKENDVVSTGGSMTLSECGVFDLLRSGDYSFLDRDNTDDIEKLYRDTFFADFFLCSSNAVTQNGELYNVDAYCTRVAPICFGPKKVIVIVGINKIVKNLDDAIRRVKFTAAPTNCLRLDMATYCQKTGECMGIDGAMCDGCKSKQRICCNYVVSAYQCQKDRVNVIIVGEELGY